MRSSAREGVPIKALLLCNPHNPIPQCYPLETLHGHLDIIKEVHHILPGRRNSMMIRHQKLIA